MICFVNILLLKDWRIRNNLYKLIQQFATILANIVQLNQVMRRNDKVHVLAEMIAPFTRKKTTSLVQQLSPIRTTSIR